MGTKDSVAARKKPEAARAAVRNAPAGSRRPAPRRRESASNLPMSPDERMRMIAEAAYLRAERRGFNGGNELDDWLEAEAEIDARLRAP